jgi:hypothetical protein
MTIEQLRAMLRAQPFRSFRIHLADGRNVDVEHPEFLAQSHSGRTVIVTKRDDTFEVIDLLLVTSLEAINGRPKSKAKKRRSGD